MRESMTYIWARRIHAGAKTFTDFESTGTHTPDDVNALYLVMGVLYGYYHEPLKVGIFIEEDEEEM